MLELARLAALPGDLELECWCSPKPCHGEALAAILRRIKGAILPEMEPFR